jgi:antitoxin component of RelBE/YafQ-DinJ toxin-antitoxin module
MSSKQHMKPFSTRLPDEVRAALQAKAASLGLTESDLGRMIIIEKLAETDSPVVVFTKELRSMTTLIIAALSDSIDLEQAGELVEQHANSDSTVSQ